MKINLNKKIILSTIIILSITFISTISKAALEFKPGAETYGQSPTNAYQLCYDLKNADSTIGTNQVDPHLMLNKDWAAVVFLAISTYGNGKEETGDYINIYNSNYHTSNGNYTGVMGKRYRSLFSTYSILFFKF